MARGEYEVATQAGGRGYFGKVTLDVHQGGRAGTVEVDFDAEHASQWQSGARFGIDYMLERIQRRSLLPTGAKIHVDSIQGHDVDTNNVVIAYVTAYALMRALGIEPPTKSPRLDSDLGLFIFPK